MRNTRKISGREEGFIPAGLCCKLNLRAMLNTRKISGQEEGFIPAGLCCKSNLRALDGGGERLGQFGGVRWTTNLVALWLS
jgi:hypothetical protein